MDKRNDIHSVKNADYSKYIYLLSFYIGGSVDARLAYGDQADYRAEKRAALDAGTFFTTDKGGCGHCGAIFAHGVLVRHEDTGETLEIGHQCADKVFGGFANAKAARANIERRIRRIKQDRAYKAKSKLDRDAVLSVNPGLESCLKLDHYIIADINDRFQRYGKISEKQIALVYKIAADLWTPALPELPKAPVVAGKKVEVTGEVLSAKFQENGYGGAYKMLVLDDRGFKVWSTIPSNIVEDVPAAEPVSVLKGKRINFLAAVTASDDDECFGFAKRPRKASLLPRVADV